MTKFCAAAALAALLLAGCAAGSGSRSGDETLLDCRAKADERFKARYTDEWNAAVEQCLKERAGD